MPDRSTLRIGSAARAFAGVSSLTVLHIDTERGWRGGERQALWLAEALARRGHRSVMACRPADVLFGRARAANVETLACAPSFALDPRAILALRRFIRGERADIVHAHTAHAATLAAAACSRTPARMIVSRRVDFPISGGISARLKYGRAAAIIAVSSAVREVVLRSGIAAERVVVVHDGVDTSRAIQPATASALSRCGVPAGAPLVVQVSQLVGHKDPLTFVRAIGAVVAARPDAHALLVGDGPLRTDVVAATGRLGLETNLHVLGYRDDADSLLAAADVVTLSSAEEGLGSVLLDGMFMRKGIAATAAGGIPEIIADGESGLLTPPGDPAALGASIVRLLGDPALRARLGARASERSSELSVERMTDATLRVYRSAGIRSRPSGR